jgi:hypothetical protein
MKNSDVISVFDLVSNTGDIVAVFEDGHVGFVKTRFVCL